RMSPMPHKKHSMEKKPVLACLFCCGRKITCGPSLLGSKDKNLQVSIPTYQYAQQQSKCEYPLESCHGM
ncbi:hypothetical protein F5I97DRAFT_1817853, partial [Phlebopus sp. FC_14]